MKLLIYSLLFVSNIAMGCSCIGYDLDEAFANYEIVFRGTVDRIGTKWIRADGDFLPSSLSQVRLNVVQSYKAELDSNITVYTQKNVESCGFPFEKGVEYVVFAYIGSAEEARYALSVEAAPAVSGCSPTIHALPAEDYYEEERLRVLEYLDNLPNL